MAVSGVRPTGRSDANCASARLSTLCLARASQPRVGDALAHGRSHAHAAAEAAGATVPRPAPGPAGSRVAHAAAARVPGAALSGCPQARERGRAHRARPAQTSRTTRPPAAPAGNRGAQRGAELRSSACGPGTPSSTAGRSPACAAARSCSITPRPRARSRSLPPTVLFASEADAGDITGEIRNARRLIREFCGPEGRGGILLFRLWVLPFCRSVHPRQRGGRRCKPVGSSS